LADQAEDPLWAIQHGMQLDIKYYIDKQLSGPISRIFMWLLSDRSYLQSIATVEEKIRNARGDKVAMAIHEKTLDNIMEKMQACTAQKLFGPGALAAHPKKIETGTRGIASFFKPLPNCVRCKIVPAKDRDPPSLCDSCSPGNARCMATGCHKSVVNENAVGIPDLYCITCTPIVGPCAICARYLALIDGVCDNCILGKCYSCGKDDLETRGGVCNGCRDFVSVRMAGMAASSIVDIEDLKRQAIAAKQECFTRCGVLTDDINCVSRECTTLFKRATLAVRIANMERK
jgi:hypothetical protein